MLPWIIQITVISILLIFLVHHLINFLKSTLTVPKIKDLVNRPNHHYEHIYNTINQHQFKSLDNININNNNESTVHVEKDYTLIDLLPQNDSNAELKMKNELKDFLKMQLRD